MFDFPATPLVGDEFTAGGVTYVYTGTTWDLLSGGSMTDYVLKAGDVMTGPLTLPEIVGPSEMNGNLNLMTGDVEVKTGIIVARANHVYTQGGGRFIFNNTDNNAWQNAFSMNGGIHLQYHQGGNNDGRMRIFTSNGGYTDTWVMETTIVSGSPGINVNGRMQAGSINNLGSQTQGGGLNFGSFVATGTDLSRHIRLYGTQYGFNVSSKSLNYCTDATSSVHSFYCGATLSYQIDTVGAVGNSVRVTAPEAIAVAADLGVTCGEDGVDIMRAMAALLAKVKQLDAEIEALKAQPRGPQPQGRRR